MCGDLLQQHERTETRLGRRGRETHQPVTETERNHSPGTAGSRETPTGAGRGVSPDRDRDWPWRGTW